MPSYLLLYGIHILYTFLKRWMKLCGWWSNKMMIEGPNGTKEHCTSHKGIGWQHFLINNQVQAGNNDQILPWGHFARTRNEHNEASRPLKKVVGLTTGWFLDYQTLSCRILFLVACKNPSEQLMLWRGSYSGDGSQSHVKMFDFSFPLSLEKFELFILDGFSELPRLM